MYSIVWKWYLQAYKCSSVQVLMCKLNYEIMIHYVRMNALIWYMNMMMWWSMMMHSMILMHSYTSWYLIYTLYWWYIPCHLMYNLSKIAEHRFSSNCGWQWAVCGSDIYWDDLTMIRVQRLLAVEFGMW